MTALGHRPDVQALARPFVGERLQWRLSERRGRISLGDEGDFEVRTWRNGRQQQTFADLAEQVGSGDDGSLIARSLLREGTAKPARVGRMRNQRGL